MDHRFDTYRNKLGARLVADLTRARPLGLPAAVQGGRHRLPQRLPDPLPGALGEVR